MRASEPAASSTERRHDRGMKAGELMWHEAVAMRPRMCIGEATREQRNEREFFGRM